MTQHKLEEQIEPYYKHTWSDYVVILSILLIWGIIGIAWLLLGKNEAFFVPNETVY